jgi:type VI secretion system protein ImpA
MESPSVLDFEFLLADVPGKNPAGVDLREDYSPQAVYRLLKDVRAAARAAERNAAWERDESAGARADWSPILKQAPQVLAAQSKDLEIAVWLLEALVRAHGFAGLRDGLRLLCGLVERFWEHVYPLPDEDGLETRVAPLAGLNGVEGEGVLGPAIQTIPITMGTSVGPFHSGHYRQALDLERLDDPGKRSARIAQGAASLQDIQKAVAETPPEFFQTLRDDLNACSETFERLCVVLEEKCGTDASGDSLAPPSSNIRNALQACRETLDYLVQPSPDANSAESPAAGREGGQAAPGRSVSVGQIGSREEAFRALLQVAEFFKRTEPHSPISYTLEQAVRWGRMPLPELLSELVPEDSTREQIFKLVGIRPEPEA